MPRHANITAACLLGFVVRFSSVAVAQDAAHASAAARSLFQEGIACTDHADWTCAADRFERAYALRPSPVIGSNLGVALAHLDRLVEAAETLRAVIRDESATPALVADAQRQIAQLEARVGRITIRVEGPLDEVNVTMDGHAIASTQIGVATPADPGDHRIEARRRGETVALASTHVDPAQAVDVALAIPALPPEPEATPTSLALTPPVLAPTSMPMPMPMDDAIARPVHHTEVWEEWWFWTIVGGVVVGAGIGITVGVLAAPGPALPGGSLGTIDGR